MTFEEALEKERKEKEEALKKVYDACSKNDDSNNMLVQQHLNKRNKIGTSG
jgi:hypothetical protein